jgi:hypothetical protein
MTPTNDGEFLSPDDPVQNPDTAAGMAATGQLPDPLDPLQLSVGYSGRADPEACKVGICQYCNRRTGGGSFCGSMPGSCKKKKKKK